MIILGSVSGSGSLRAVWQEQAGLLQVWWAAHTYESCNAIFRSWICLGDPQGWSRNGIAKIWQMYRNDFRYEEDILGRDAFTDLLVESGMKVRLKMRKPRTTDSTHGLPTFPNIIKDIIPTGPNQLWVSDITYIPVWKQDGNYRYCYLSLILDAYSKEIVGWRVGDSPYGVSHSCIPDGSQATWR